MTATVVVCLAGAVAYPSAAAATCRPAASSDGWAAAEGPGIARAFAVLPGGRLAVADDRALFESEGLGCPWRQVWRMPDTPSPGFPFATERITRLAMAGNELFMGLSGPHVLASSDGGRTWETRDDGLRPSGVPNEIVVSASDPRVLYLTATTDVSDRSLGNQWVPTSQGTTARTTLLYRSDDGGAHWALVASPYSIFGPSGSGISAGGEPGVIWDVEVDELDARVLWAATNEGLFASVDGGASWTPAVANGSEPGPDLRAVTVVRPPGSPARATAIEPTTGAVYQSANGVTGPWTRSTFVGFRSVYAHSVLEPMVSLAHARPDGPVVAAGPKGVFVNAGAWSDASPMALGSGWAGTLVDLVSDPHSPRTFWGRERGGATIYRYSIPVESKSGTRGAGPSATDPADPLGSLSIPDASVGALAPPSPARLTPARATIRLEPGESVTRIYELTLPPRPTPLDVYFLLDSTQSTSDVIRALARSISTIATRLRARSIDAWLGVGEFRTYPYPGEERYGGEQLNFAYRRDADLAPPNARLQRALLAIEGEGESGANLVALYQAATGEGQDVAPPGPSGADVEANQQASFRPGALNVVVHVADTYFATPERGAPGRKYPPPTWPGPTFEQAIAALSARDIHHVGAALGVDIDDPPSLSPNVLSDLQRVSEGTGTFAGAGGVDCDGEGRSDLPAGAPLVCGLPYERAATDLVPAITGLLDGVRDTGAVALVETTGARVVTGIAPDMIPSVDLRTANELRFDVTFTCPRLALPSPSNVRLAALLKEDVVAHAQARVVCRAERDPLMTPTGTDAGRAVAPVVPLVPPPPPPPVVNGGPAPANAPAPAPAAEPAPAPASAPNPQVVPAQQRQVQPQLAFVHAVQQVREQVSMEHAMVRVSSTRSDPLAATKYGLATATLSLMFVWGLGLAVARHPRTALAHWSGGTGRRHRPR
ncbi:MAG TPA: hypothetical protein VIG64_01630 [Actinomycetota bacterium]|jgi:hypothetical protein